MVIPIIWDGRLIWLDTAVTVEAIIKCGKMRHIGLDLEYGDITGTLELTQRNSTKMLWKPVPDVTLTNPAGSGSGKFYNIGNVCGTYLKFKYTHSSGSDYLRLWGHGKQ